MGLKKSWSASGVAAGNIIYPDGWHGYDGLVMVGYDQHVHIHKSQSFASA